MTFNPTTRNLQYCDGDNWRSFHKTPSPALDWTSPTRTPIYSADGLANRFGTDVSISGNRLAVGAPYDNGRRGAVYIFERTDGGWTQTDKFTASDIMASDDFGRYLELYGDTLVVTNPGDDNPAPYGSNSGSLYIFTKGESGWTQSAKLLHTTPTTQDYFGIRPKIFNDLLVAGAHMYDEAGVDNSGAAFVFKRNGTSWNVTPQKLVASNPTANATFGSAIAVSEDTIMAAASTLDGEAHTSVGAVYVFKRTGMENSWTQTQILTPQVQYNAQQFGYDIAINGTTAAIAAQGENGYRGAVYIYERSGDQWLLQQRITGTGVSSGHKFGTRVALEDNTLVVTVENSNAAGATGAGAAIIFKRENNVWSEVSRIYPSVVTAGANFGTSVSMSHDTIIVGASMTDLTDTNNGLVYSFTTASGCQNPARPAGALIYNQDSRVPQWCDGAIWQSGGPIRTTAASSTSCANPARPVGTIIFNEHYRVMQYCDGDEWRRLGRAACKSCGGKPDEKLVFYTLSTRRGIDIGGVNGGDAICQNLAVNAGLKGTYKAWLSNADPASAPVNRFTHPTVPYVRIDGERIADSWSALVTNGTLLRVALTETGHFPTTVNAAWTNVNTDGTTFSTDPAQTCQNWAGAGTGHYGNRRNTNASWTNFSAAATCTASYRLYCFEQ